MSNSGQIWNFEVVCNGKVAVRQSFTVSFGGASDSQNLDYTVDMDRLVHTGVVQGPNEGTIGKTRRTIGSYLASMA